MNSTPPLTLLKMTAADELLIGCRQSVQSCQQVAQGVAIRVGSLSNSSDNYSAASAPFDGQLVSNTVGWIVARTDDGLATHFLYLAR